MNAVINHTAPNATALTQINRHLEHYTPRTNLAFDDGIFHIQNGEKNLSPKAVMSVLANHAAQLLAFTDQDRIKVCAGPKCVLVFKDTSKSGRRRWCSMDTCGNRTKAAKFRENSADL